MPNSTEWVDAQTAVPIFVDADWTDPFGTRVAEGKYGLAFGGVIIEGTLDDLLILSQDIAQVVAEKSAEVEANLCRECGEEPAEEWGMCGSCIHNAQRSGWNPPSE